MLFTNFFSSIRTLEARIRDLEQTAEALLGSNAVLERELEKAQFGRDKLLDKLFQVTGIGDTQGKAPPSMPKEFQTLARAAVPWPKVKESLELEARKKYWENKKGEQEELEKEREDLKVKDNAS
jgi:transposase